METDSAAPVVRPEAVRVKSTKLGSAALTPDLQLGWDFNSFDIVLIEELIPLKDCWRLKEY